MSERPTTVLLVGAAGTFGRRLAARLAVEPGVRIILAGRTRRRLEVLRRDLGSAADICLLDRDHVTAAALRATGAAIVIDAAGPFQDSRTNLIEAAIDARVHYIDLADGRAFVSDIRRYGAAAQRAGVAVISGASSTPALSHAVLDQLTGNWRRIETIRVAISPARQTPRGKSVVRAILSWAGRPVRLFRDGGWTQARGWGAARRIEFPGIGMRLASLCETPDLDLLAGRYQPRIAAEFLAGVTPDTLHRSLVLAGLAVRWGWLRGLHPLAAPGRLLASLLAPFGGDRGGMVVAVSGRDGAGQPVFARWSLAAAGGRGPYVPTIAALALVRRIRDGALAFRGASPCVGLLSLADFRRDFERLEIETRTEFSRPAAPLFEQALGPRFALLPPVTQAVHRPDPVLLLDGVADIDGAETGVGRLLARLMGFPGQARGAPLRVVIEAGPDGAERWSRAFNGYSEPLCCPPAASPSGIPNSAMLTHRASGITPRMAAGGQPKGTRRFRPGAAARPTTVAPLRALDRSCPRTEIAASERFRITVKGSRVYPDRVMRSVLARPDPARGTIEEQFGDLRFRLKLDADKTGLTMTATAAWWRAIRLPLWLLPGIAASERADGERHLFDVAIALPLIGRLVHYRGWLALRDQHPSSSSGKALNGAGGVTGEAACR
jgi:NAD(P)-dependent dehydrogenase (short-subunit alcohol dehydrogenase family)